MAAVTASELYAALWSLAEGPGATIAAVIDRPALMRLRYVVAEAQPGPGLQPTAEQVASLAIEHIEAAARTLGPTPEDVLPTDPDLASAAAAALGVGAGNGGLLPHQRRKKASGHLNMRTDTYLHRRADADSHEQRLVRQLADEMFRRESYFALRTAGDAIKHRKATGDALASNWLMRYEQYYRIWNQLSALSGNLRGALRGAHQHDPQILREYGSYALYDFARYLSELQRFTDDFGGLWIFADANIEKAIADAVWIIVNAAETTHRDDSVLRRLAPRGRELDDFLRELESTGADSSLIAEWIQMIERCTCENPDGPGSPKCRPHRMVFLAETYMDLIDADWYRLADWYREPPEHQTLIDPDRLYRHLKLIADEDP